MKKNDRKIIKRQIQFDMIDVESEGGTIHDIYCPMEQEDFEYDQVNPETLIPHQISYEKVVQEVDGQKNN